MIAADTTTMDLVIRFEVAASPTTVAGYLDALHSLADIMAVQAEDGLWSLGSPEAESDDGPSDHVAGIVSTRVQAVLIEATSPTTPEGL